MSADLEKLLPCPFCGGDASHNGGGGSVFGRMWWAVGCKACDIWFADQEVWDKANPGMLDPAYPPKHCFAAWNTRALTAENAALRAKAETALQLADARLSEHGDFPHHPVRNAVQAALTEWETP